MNKLIKLWKYARDPKVRVRLVKQLSDDVWPKHVGYNQQARKRGLLWLLISQDLKTVKQRMVYMKRTEMGSPSIKLLEANL